MAGVVNGSFGSPDERRTLDKTEVQVVDLGSVKAAKLTLQPGWRRSDCIKPIAGTESCQIHHEGMVAAGQTHVRHNDGTELEIGPGDAYVIPDDRSAPGVEFRAFLNLIDRNIHLATNRRRHPRQHRLISPTNQRLRTQADDR